MPYKDPEAKKAHNAVYREVNKERCRLISLVTAANQAVRKDSKITLPFTALGIVHIDELVAVQGTRCAYEDHGGCKFPGQPMIFLPNSGDTRVSYDHIVARRWFRILQSLIKAGHPIKWQDPHARWNRALVHLACNFAQGADFIEGIRSPLTGNLVRHILPDEYLDKDTSMDLDIAYYAAKDRT